MHSVIMIASSDSSCVRRVYRRGREEVIVLCRICMVYGIFKYLTNHNSM